MKINRRCGVHKISGSLLLWVAHASRVLAMTSRHRGLLRKRLFWRVAKTNTRDACATPGSLTARARADCRLAVLPDSLDWVRRAAARFQVMIPASAAAEQPATGRPSQRALSTTLDNPPAHRRRHCP